MPSPLKPTGPSLPAGVRVHSRLELHRVMLMEVRAVLLVVGHHSGVETGVVREVLLLAHQHHLVGVGAVLRTRPAAHLSTVEAGVVEAQRWILPVQGARHCLEVRVVTVGVTSLMQVRAQYLVVVVVDLS